VSVVRGPASATHGAGALAGVIDVETYNGLTFQGADLTLRQGVVNEYTAAEIRYGHKLSDTSGLFSITACRRGRGSQHLLHWTFLSSRERSTGERGRATGQWADPKPRCTGLRCALVQSSRKLRKRTVGDLGAVCSGWRRGPPSRSIYSNTRPAGTSLDEWTTGREIQNHQYTLAASFKKELSPTWNLELLQSDDLWDFKDQRAFTSRSRHASRTKTRHSAARLRCGLHRGPVAGVRDGVFPHVVS